MKKQKQFELHSGNVIAAITALAFLLSQSLLAQWTLQATVPENGDYPCLSVYSPSGVIIAGGNEVTAKVFKSTDNGVHWNDITGNLANTPRLISVWAIDGNTIFAGDGGAFNAQGGNAKVWKTTNGGVNWVNILSTGGTAGYINGITFSRTVPSFGIIQSDPPGGAGQPYWIRTTTDGGNTWQASTAPGIASSISSDFTVFAIDNMFYGFGISPDPSAYITTDGGATWNNRILNIPGQYTGSVSFSSDKLYGIGTSGGCLPLISRSNSGGANFNSLNTGTSLTGGARSCWVYGTSWCFVTSWCCPSNSVIKSTDNGATWTAQTTPGVGGINDIDLINSSGNVYAYAINGSGNVIRLQQVLTGIEPINSNTPSEYKLFQNYPNPFNPATNIRFQIQSTGNVVMKIFDNLGREVSTLVNEQLNPGTYEVNWDASNHSSGIYYYRITSGGFTETRKMMLVK